MKTKILRTVAVICLLAIGLGVLILAFDSNTAGKRDFISYWAAGQQLIHGADPYDTQAILRLQRATGLEGDRPNLMLNLPSAFFLALPLGLVGAKVGEILWLLVLVICLSASIRMLWALHGRPNNRVHLLGYLFAPVLACLMAGQLGFFLLLGIVLFLRFYESRPFLAGWAMLLCSVKPHLFLPFGLVLLAWIVSRKAYRILAGILTSLSASCILSFCLDAHAWAQYSRMMSSTAELQQDFVPTLSMVFRLLIDQKAAWLQFVPVIAASAWALWYFWAHRAEWNWMAHGQLVLLVSVVCAPHAWFTDEAVLLPAVLAAVYWADGLGRSLLFFGLISGAALIELLCGVQITSPFYLWTAPAWLVWYLLATRREPSTAERNAATDAKA